MGKDHAASLLPSRNTEERIVLGLATLLIVKMGGEIPRYLS